MTKPETAATAHEEWRADDDTVCIGRGKDAIVIAYATQDIYTTKKQARARAKQIAREHNSHDELLAALKAIQAHINVPAISRNAAWHKAGVEICKNADAAIAKATGEQP